MSNYRIDNAMAVDWPAPIPLEDVVLRRTHGYMLIEVNLDVIPQDGESQEEYDARCEQRMTRSYLEKQIASGDFDLIQVSSDPDSKSIGC